MLRLAAAVLMIGTAAPAWAQDADVPEGPPERVRSVILYGEDTCPKPTAENEVVVCARGGDSPYRLEEQFRPSVERPDSVSWARRVDDVIDSNRAGMPGSCSPFGSGGFTGCSRASLSQWSEIMRERRREAARIP